MDLSFFTGNPAPNPSGMSWMSSNTNNSNPGMNFSSPSLNYQPGMTLGDYFSPSTGTGAGQATGGFPGLGSLSGQLGMNVPTLQLGLGALGSLSNIYGGFQANKLAKDQLSFTKDITNTNLNNQIQSYNTALEDRARSRAAAENRSQSSADEYIQQNKLSR